MYTAWQAMGSNPLRFLRSSWPWRSFAYLLTTPLVAVPVLAALMVTVVALVLIVLIALILVVSGPVTDAVGEALGLGEAVQVVWSIVKWPVLAVIVVLIVRREVGIDFR